MPTLTAFTPAPKDARIYNTGTPAFTDSASWEAGCYYTYGASGNTIPPVGFTSEVTMAGADARTIYYTSEIMVSSWNPGNNIILLRLANMGAGTCFLDIIANAAASVPYVKAQLTDFNGTTHATNTYNLSNDTRYVIGAACKLYESGGNTVVDVILRVDGTDRQTLSADIISGATKTLRFASIQQVLTGTYGKGGTGTVSHGVAKVNGSSGLGTDTGDVWSLSDVDDVRTRTQRYSSSQTDVYALALLTVYSNAADGDGWPTPYNSGAGTGMQVSWRLPTSDTDSVWTCSAGTDRYALIDDALGSYSAADYIRSTDDSWVQTLGYGNLSLGSGYALAVGTQMRGTGGGIKAGFQLESTGISSSVRGSSTANTQVDYIWYNRKPSMVAAKGSTQVCMF